MGNALLSWQSIIDGIMPGAGMIIVSVFLIILLVFHLIDMAINRDKCRVYIPVCGAKRNNKRAVLPVGGPIGEHCSFFVGKFSWQERYSVP